MRGLIHRISFYIFIFVWWIPVSTFALIPESNENLDSALIRTDKVPVYYKMSIKSPIMKNLIRGDRVIIELKIQDEEGEWCGIREEGETEISGFVLCEHLEEEGFPLRKEKRHGEFIRDMPDLIRAAGEGNIVIVRELLDKGTNVHARDKEHGWTALMAASLSGSVDIVQLLLSRGARVDERDKFSWTPLMIASRSGHTDIVRVLLDADADVNAKTRTNYTALMAAAKQGHTDIVKLLLSRGADANERDQFGWRAITLAERNGYEEIVDVLKEMEEGE